MVPVGDGLRVKYGRRRWQTVGWRSVGSTGSYGDVNMEWRCVWGWGRGEKKGVRQSPLSITTRGTQQKNALQESQRDSVKCRQRGKSRGTIGRSSKSNSVDSAAGNVSGYFRGRTYYPFGMTFGGRKRPLIVLSFSFASKCTEPLSA